jgi:WD40 repeat protein
LLLAWGSKSAQLRDAASGNVVREFSHREVVYHAAFSLDGQRVVTSSKDGTVCVWETATGKLAAPVLEHSGMVAWAQFSSDGNTLLTVRDRHYVQLWNWRQGRRLGREIPRRSLLSHASLSPNGSNVLTVAWSGYAHVYEANSTQIIREFLHQGGVVDAAFSPDGRYIATASHDGNVWIRETGDAVADPQVLPAGNQVEEIAFSSDGRMLAVASRGGHARVWDLRPTVRGVRRLPGNEVQWVQFDPFGRRALVLSTKDRSALDVYDSETGKLITSSTLKPNQVSRALFSPDARRILAFGRTSTAFVFDTESGRRIVPPLVHERRVEDAIWSPDGKFILTAAGAAGARAWEAATGKVARHFEHASGVSAIALSADGRQLATGHEDKAVRIWETLTGRPLGQSIEALGTIRQIQFSPDGRRLAICTDASGTGGIVEVRDVGSGAVIGQPLLHRDEVNSFEFSHDGRSIATACEDHTARVWESETGYPVSPWLPHDYEVLRAAFSPEATRLVTQSRRGAVRLWNARTGEPITAPILYTRYSGDGGVSYSPDGRRLLISRGAHEAFLRDLQPEGATLEELKLRAQVLSCTRFDPASGMVPLDEASINESWTRLRASRARN